MTVLKCPNQEISEFGKKVFSYCLEKFGLIYKDNAFSPLFTEEIGNAVVFLELHIRDFLRERLHRGIQKIVATTDSNQRLQALQQLLDLKWKPLEDTPILTAFLGYLALITELIIFTDSAGLPVRKDWFIQIWTSIYDARLKKEFQGKWKDLKKEAERLCGECPMKEELFEELRSLEHPYAEIDPLLETSFKDLDPFFMYGAIGSNFEFPRFHGLSQEVIEKMTLNSNSAVEA